MSKNEKTEKTAKKLSDRLSKEFGLSKVAIAGLIGNAHFESKGFQSDINEENPVVKGSRGGFGLFQWTGQRRKALEKFASDNNKNLSDEDTQIDFLVKELQTDHAYFLPHIKKAKNVESAAKIAQEKFFFPSEKTAHSDQRIKDSEKIYSMIKDEFQNTESESSTTQAEPDFFKSEPTEPVRNKKNEKTLRETFDIDSDFKPTGKKIQPVPLPEHEQKPEQVNEFSRLITDENPYAGNWGIPIEGVNQSAYGVAQKVSSPEILMTTLGVGLLSTVDKYKSLTKDFGSQLSLPHTKYDDGIFNEDIQTSQPLTPEQLEIARNKNPSYEIPDGASYEQVLAAMDRQDREGALRYINTYATRGFSSSAAELIGGSIGSLADIPALKGAGWLTRGFSLGSELLASHVASSAISTIGGATSATARQIIANNAWPLAALKGAVAFGGFTSIEEFTRLKSIEKGGILTPSEQDHNIMESFHEIFTASFVGAGLGLAAEALTGKVIDKAFTVRDTRKVTDNLKEQWENFKKTPNFDELPIQRMTFEPNSESELYRRVALVIKSFNDMFTELVERNTLDLISQAFEAGKDVNYDFLFAHNRHDAWSKLQQLIKDAQLTTDQFATALKQLSEQLIAEVEKSDSTIETLAELGLNEALIELALKDEADVFPSSTDIQKFVDTNTNNVPEFENPEIIGLEFSQRTKSPDDIFSEIINAYPEEELKQILEFNEQNIYAKEAIGARNILDLEQSITEFLQVYARQIANDLKAGIELTSEYFADLFSKIEIAPEDAQSIITIVQNMIETLSDRLIDGVTQITPEQLNNAIKDEFLWIKSQVVRKILDAHAFNRVTLTMEQAIQNLDATDGTAFNEGFKALLDRSLLLFDGANSGTYRKMNIAGLNYYKQFGIELQKRGVWEFWNDPASSLEITRAIEAEDLGRPMDGFSEQARHVAEMVNSFYQTALDMFAEQGVYIPKLNGRIHRQWHNPLKINRIRWTEIFSKSYSERVEENFNEWFNFIYPLIDLAASFKGENAFEDGKQIDVYNPNNIRAILRKTFDKITKEDYERKKSNIRDRRSKERIYQFKDAEAFHKYNEKYGYGTAQNAIDSELINMFREIELVKDWGIEPEKMLANLKDSLKDQEGWREYEISNSKNPDTPDRLMHLMRYGAASTGAFSEFVRNAKTYEFVTKLGNLIFLNTTDAVSVANSLNRLGLPMLDSITDSLKEVLSLYTPEQRKDFANLFAVMNEQYFGSYYKHLEDRPLNNTLQQAARLVNKLTGSANSDKSNLAMVSKTVGAWIATSLERGTFDDLVSQAQNHLSRYDIRADEWDLLKDAIFVYEGTKYLGWDSVHDIPDARMVKYLNKKGIKNPTTKRIDITRNDLAQKYRMLVQDMVDMGLNRASLVERDLLRFKQDPSKAHVMNDLISMSMLFKTWGTLWFKNHVGGRIYGNGAEGFRISQIQGTADWHGLMKLILLSFAMEVGVNQAKEFANKGEFLPLNKTETYLDALMGAMGPIAYLERINANDLTGSVARFLGGPIAGDVTRLSRIVSGYSKGLTTGKYSTANINLIKFVESQFGGVPFLKTALHALFFDNMIQNQKGKRAGHNVQNAIANIKEQSV